MCHEKIDRLNKKIDVLTDQVSELTLKNEQLEKENKQLKEKNKQLEQKVQQLTLEKALISENYHALRKKVFGKSSEKVSYDTSVYNNVQLSLFPEEQPNQVNFACENGPSKPKAVVQKKLDIKLRS